MGVGNVTPEQERVLDYIDSFVTVNGYAPTVREIGRSLEISRERARRRHDELERMGKIRVRSVAGRRIARSTRLT